MLFGDPHPNGKLEILYQLVDSNPSYYKEHAKSTENIIQKADPKDFRAAFDTVMNSKENNAIRCISLYTMVQILESKKINDYILQTRNDYLPLYLLDNLDFHSNIETEARFGLGYPMMVNLGYPSVSKFIIYLYNLNPAWPELLSIINDNPPTSHYILIYFSINAPLSITIPAFEGLIKDIRTLPNGFNQALATYKEKFPIEIIAKYIGALQYCFFTCLPLIFIRYHNEIISNKQVFTKALSTSTFIMLLKYGIYTPFDVNFEESVKILTDHFCVVDGEQRGYSNPPLYTEFRVYLNKAREMHPDKYAKFLSEADESVLSAFSFDYDPRVFKRVFEKSYCPWVYVVLFHDKIHKSMIPWHRMNEYEPAPDLVTSIKLYNGIDEELMKEFLNKMSVAKFVYLFHDYYDCKSIPDLKNRLLNDPHDYDPFSILYEAIAILGDAVDVSRDISKYVRYGGLESFSKLVKLCNVHLTKDDAMFELNNKYFMNNPVNNSADAVLLIRRMLTDYPELVDEYKEQLKKSYYAPLYLKEFIPSYEFDQLDPTIVVMLANSNGVKSLTDKQVEVLTSLSVKDCNHKDHAFKAVSNAVFNLDLSSIQIEKICQTVFGLIEYFIRSDGNYSMEELPERTKFVNDLQIFLKNHPDVKQQITSVIPKSMENVFDYIEIMYKIKI